MTNVSLASRIYRCARVQSLRILLVVVIIPFTLALFEAHGADTYTRVLLPVHAAGLMQLLALGLLGGALLAWPRVPNAFMLGPLAITIALTVGEVQLSSMPTQFSNAGQLLIGCTVGSRLEQEFVKKAPHYMLVVALSILLAIVLAVQMPRNFGAPSHTLMHELASSPPWRDALGKLLRPLPVLVPAAYYGLLAPLARGLDIWEAEYLQILEGENPVAEWTKGTWLSPLLAALAPGARAAFESEYRRRVAQAYPRQPDGKTLFSFRRLFIVAVL